MQDFDGFDLMHRSCTQGNFVCTNLQLGLMKRDEEGVVYWQFSRSGSGYYTRELLPLVMMKTMFVAILFF